MQPYHYRFDLVRVVDGDTVEIDIDLGFDLTLRNQMVRLSGIDTPELRGGTPESREHAKLAQQRTGELVGRAHLFKSDNRDGKYGRLLGDFLVRMPLLDPRGREIDGGQVLPVTRVLLVEWLAARYGEKPDWDELRVRALERWPQRWIPIGDDEWQRGAGP